MITFYRTRPHPYQSSSNTFDDLYAKFLEDIERLDTWDGPMIEALRDPPKPLEIPEHPANRTGGMNILDLAANVENRSSSEGSQFPDAFILSRLSGPEPRCMDPLDLELNRQVRQILHSGCAICPKQDDLSDCGFCLSMTYCSQEHLLLDQASHEKICGLIVAARERAEEWRVKLEQDPSQPFRTKVGELHLIPGAQRYFAELSTLIELHEPIRHRCAVERQLIFAFHIMYMSGIDSYGYRFKVPALMMRINRDQECYDFMKWRTNQSEDPNSKTALDYLSLRFANPTLVNPIIPNPRRDFVGYEQEDIFEPIDVFSPETPIMTLIPLCLVKIRFLVDVQRLHLAVRAFGDKLNGDVLDLVLKNIPFTKQIAEKKDLIKSAVARRATMKALMGQVLKLYRKVKSMNHLVWKGMAWLMRGDTPWPSEDHTLVEEMEAQVKMNWESWIETPGAITLLREIMTKAGDL
ncbi:uncharacterized protein N7496_006609 [Penicillium cataractarum]|uniref:MYND-type domain-containing protein n=1 Tax=Penicillium cataractarum TaxID=2100454 RepID=A0A9W9S2K7_9EURO|nr:uncharacterized protein N7496_006609 [Penicillium cataractarum]KAJ5370517.1 hypothetical protein N7496_006609 [Penicillium cataractarum]